MRNKNLTQKYIAGFKSTEVIVGKSILYVDFRIRRIVCYIQKTIINFEGSGICQCEWQM